MYQTRCTGGVLIEHGDGKYLHVDPGPGALTQMKRIHYDPALTNSLIVSHAHPDHYSDAETVIEGMTLGSWVTRGSLYGSNTVIHGKGTLGPCISKYHQAAVKTVSILEPGSVLDIDGMTAEVCRTSHSDPTNVGFRFDSGHGMISYVSDTSYSEEIAMQHMGSRVLLLPVTTPDSLRIPYHLCTEDAVSFINLVKPEMAIFIHLGITMIKRGPTEQAAEAERKTSIKTVSVKDLDVLTVEDELSLSSAQTYDDDWIPSSSPG
jgi:phosphoribosyl 1,2-cyclic phosphodiesterase